MAGKTLITFAQEGQEPITFEVSAGMMDKIYRKIERINGSAVLGTQVSGAAEWWLKETSDKIIQPLMAEFPDPEPIGVAERVVQIQKLQSEIDRMKREAIVLPVTIVEG
jgi:hypothetical protein